MGGKRLHATPPERIHTCVGPDIRAIAAEAAQFDIVSVRTFADAEDADELVLRTLE
jgi:hypothetical protein